MRKGAVLLVLLSGATLARAEKTSLDLGLDYRLRGVSIGNNDMDKRTKDSLSYYSQSARFYMRAWLNEDVEASFRLHSINLWGMEGTSTLATAYPKADGTPWVEEAYIHLPNMMNKRVNVILGRQPITVGDGMLVSSDDAGFNAIRAQVALPLKTELDVFNAKVVETLNGHKDADLQGLIFRARQDERHWELGVIQEFNGAGTNYVLGPSTYTASRVERRFYDLRLFGDLKDAYYKLELAMEQGEARILPANDKIKIKGIGQKIELGAQKDTEKWGRFGVKAIFALGSGDDNGSTGTDESFRPTFAHRWDGLQRSGYGGHFAATLSDAYDPNAPFTPGATGLPAGVSGIKTLGFGIFSTQKVFWTGSLDYYTYESRTSLTGLRDLGSEIDASVTYRYTGFVTFSLGEDLFFPGNVFGANATRVARTTLEAHVHF
jgi:hypothetical protein